MGYTKTIIEICSEKHKRAFVSFNDYIKNTELHEGQGNILSIKENTNFNFFRGILYSFFESQSILVSSNFSNVKLKNKKDIQCTWGYLIFIEGTEIREGGFPSREMAEVVAFTKAFQFLDTRLFILDTTDRFYDDGSAVSCLNVNWSHLDKVIQYRRKNWEHLNNSLEHRDKLIRGESV